jgi:hypothetical protein
MLPNNKFIFGQNDYPNMKEQNFKNHSQLVFGWHGLTFFAILAVLIGSFINLNSSAPENKYSASLICVIALICCFFFAYVRIFALKAQDRAIRAEENLRHFALTGKLLPAQITHRTNCCVAFCIRRMSSQT